MSEKEGCQRRNVSKGRAIVVVVCFVDINRRDRQTASSSPIDSLNETHHHLHAPHLTRPHPASPFFFLFFFCVFRHASPFSLLCACRWCLFFVVMLLLLWARGRPIDQTDSALVLSLQTYRCQPAQPAHPCTRPTQPTNQPTNQPS